MKFKLLSFIFLALGINLFGQTYPEVTIRDIQFLPADSLELYGLSNTEPKPPLAGDTVIVTGVIMNQVRYGANLDSAVYLHFGVPSFYMMDTAVSEWGGIIVRDLSASPNFGILDSGLVVKIKGQVEEYFTTTELNVFEFEPENVIGIQKRPEPVLLTLDSLFTPSNTPKYTAEKWESVYIELRDLTVVNNQAIGSNSYIVADDNNIQIIVYAKSDYFRNRFQIPLIGTKIKKLKGFIETRNNSTIWYLINPLYPDDIEFGDISPPNISNVIRDKATVAYGESVAVTAKVYDADATAQVTGVKLNYAVNDGAFQAIDMILENVLDSLWKATIPALNDSSLVKFYLEAKDLDEAVSMSPSSGESSPYFYLVLNRDIKISDVQYSPFGTGFSGYNGYEITVSGIVTADTSDIEGDGSNISPQVYIQNGTGPWSGIQIFGTEALNLVRGDDVTVTGMVNESFGVTRIQNLDDPSNITLNSSGNPLPDPFTISTGDISNSFTGLLPAESYEGVLVKYSNIKVVDENADGNPGPDQGSGGSRNFGEMFVADAGNIQTRVELQDGTHDYNNFWDASLDGIPIRIIDGDTFQEIIGIIFFSFSNYKLVPRRNEDFVGHVTTGINELNDAPISYSISQNYPNPFNPSTTINYSIPKEGYVKLKIYNVLAQNVATLIDGVKNAGKHQVIFHGENLSSGIYFYRIEAGEYQSVKKMILLK